MSITLRLLLLLLPPLPGRRDDHQVYPGWSQGRRSLADVEEQLGSRSGEEGTWPREVCCQSPTPQPERRNGELRFSFLSKSKITMTCRALICLLTCSISFFRACSSFCSCVFSPSLLWTSSLLWLIKICLSLSENISRCLRLRRNKQTDEYLEVSLLKASQDRI